VEVEMTLPQALAAIMMSLCLLSAPRAQAQSSAEDKAAADSLFRDGRRLVQEGKYAEACPKLAASQRLDPAIGTLLNLGDCYVRTGQMASAWASFNHAEIMARSANDKVREQEAMQRAKVLEGKLARLVIEVPATSRAGGIEVRRDGTAIEPALWGSAIPIDPGIHAIQVTAPGKEPWSKTIEVEPRPGVTTVTVPGLMAARVPEAPSGRAPGGEGRAAEWSGQRTAGLVVGGAGVVGLAIGAGFGGLAITKNSDSKTHCRADEPNLCDADGVALRDEVETAANVSNVGFILGGAGLLAGVILFVTAPSGDAERPLAALQVQAATTSGATGLILQGAW
jgi:hypothetical protein